MLLRTCAAYASALGSRTSSSDPRRNDRLSQPSGSAVVIGSSAHCGNWDATSRATSVASISTRIARRRAEEEGGDMLFVSER
jgi:hypothetical protein